ncbi:MAG: YicC/YloC family endoribonuclease [Butyricicoccaceae bacterium]
MSASRPTRAAIIAVTVNHALAERYLAALRELAEKYGLRDDVTVMSLAKLPDVLGSERIEQDADEMTQRRSDRVWRGLRRFRPNA